MKRYGQVLGIKPEYIEEYSRLHAAVWPEVLKMIHDCNIRNYSIYLPARECLLESLRLDPQGAARARLYLAEILAHEQKYQEAAAEIQSYLKVNPRAADAATLKAMAMKWQAQSNAKP